MEFVNWATDALCGGQKLRIPSKHKTEVTNESIRSKVIMICTASNQSEKGNICYVLSQ